VNVIFCANYRNTSHINAKAASMAHFMALIKLFVAIGRHGGFAWGAWSLWVDLQKKAPLAVVHIEGDINPVDREDLAKRLKTVVHGSYFSTDLVAIRDAVLLSPWVESLSVQRRWPDGIRVMIVEKKAVARWGEQRFLSAKGEIFQPKAGEKLSDLPYCLGLKVKLNI
jgi:cell division protein FtsQ